MVPIGLMRKSIENTLLLLFFVVTSLSAQDTFFDQWFETIEIKAEPQSAQIGDLMVTPPPAKVLQPSTFPTIVFNIHNKSTQSVTCDYKLLLPEGWGRVSFYSQPELAPRGRGAVRSTINIPSDALADHAYQVRLAVRCAAGVDTAIAILKIDPKPDIQFKFNPGDLEMFAGATDSIRFVVRNNGNLNDIVLITPQISTAWEISGYTKHLYLKPHEEKIVTVVVKSPEHAKPGDRTNLSIEAQSLAAEKLWQELTVYSRAGIKITSRTKEARVGTLNPVFPVNIGLTINRINRDKYPLAAIYLQTGQIDLGLAMARFEITQRSYSTSFEETPPNETDRIRLELVRTQGHVVLGDAYVVPNQLMTFRSITQQTDFREYGELSRGVQTLYNIKGVTVDYFQGRQLFTEHKFTYINTRIPLTNWFNLIPAYMERDTSHVFSLSNDIWLGEGLDIKYTAGFSENIDRTGPRYGAGHIRFRYQNPKLDFLLGGHWADDEYAGVDRGKFGSMLTTRFNPVQSIYFWTHLHYYRNWVPLLTNIPSNSYRIQTRTVFNKRKWPFFNIGVLLRNDDHDNGVRVKNNVFDTQIHYPGPFIQPLLKFKYTESNSINRQLVTKRVATAGYLAMIERFRIKFEESYVRLDDNPPGWVTDVYLRTGFKGFIFGVYVTTGYVYRLDENALIIKEKVDDYGIRGNFRLRPFGKDYNMQLEVGKQTDYINDFKSDWTVLLSLSAGTVPRFHLPVPFVQSRARVYGQLFVDRNKNGIREADEPGVTQVLLFLNDQDVVSDANGEFFFDPIEAGEYPFHVDVTTLPASLSLRNPLPKTLTLWRGGQIYLQIPLYSLCSIDGYVYLDENLNQRMDSGEVGVEQVKIKIEADDGKQWEVYTNSQGFYNLPDLIPGAYTISVDVNWLPRKTELLNKKRIILLTPESPHSRSDFNVRKKQMEIRKTFSNTSK